MRPTQSQSGIAEIIRQLLDWRARRASGGDAPLAELDGLLDQMAACPDNPDPPPSAAQPDLLHTLMETIPVPIFYKDLQGVYLGCNRAFEELTGLTRENIVGRESSAFGAPELVRLQKIKDRELLAHPGHQEYEAEFLNVKGRRREIILHKATIQDDSGRLVGIVGTVTDITRMKRQEKAFREHTLQYLDFFDQAPLAIFQAEPGGRLVNVNQAFAEVFGYDSPAEVVAARLDAARDLCQAAAEYQRLEARALADGVAKNFQLNLRRTGGEEFVGNLQVRAVRDAKGDLAYLEGFVEDVTQRLAAERRLRVSEERLRQVITHMPVMLAALDREGRVLAWNRECERVTGYRAEDLRDNPQGLELVSSDPGFRRWLRGEAADASRTSRDRETELRHLDGSRRVVSWFNISRDFPVPGWHSWAVGMDVTRQRLSEEALQWQLVVSSALAGLAQSLLSPSPDLDAISWEVLERAQSLTSAVKGGLISFEPEYGSAWGPPRLKIRLWTGEPEDFAALVLEDPARLPVQASAFHGPGERPVAALGGLAGLAWANLAVAPVILANQVTGALVVGNAARKIGARELKALERLAALYALALEGHRHHALRHALEKQLRQAQKMEAMGTLAGGIAHDFNNILGAIIGYTELAALDAETGQARPESLEEVLKASERARELVRQILTFSRQAEQERVPTRLSSLVKEACRFLRASLPSTVDIVSEIAAPEAIALVDATQIHQVLMNLATNAAQAMEQGGVLRVRLTADELGPADTAGQPHLEPGPYLRLEVSDTGLGIPPEILDRIFEPFFTTKKMGEGTGMGLAVVHGIVRSHGGGLRVWSEPGGGATFQVLLPQVALATLPAGGGQAAAPTGSERVLFVDDEADLVEVGQLLLGKLGYRVEALTSPEAAWERLLADPTAYDLLISDQTMPRLTGSQLAKRAYELRPDLPVVLVTGYSRSLAPESLADTNVKLVLMKPLNKSDLATNVRRALDEAADGDAFR
ncbi:MAG: PAS domain S-box protein [Deltaproteobacteria bacterium]|nr:PAS domain S-box protein [Deltaproteobacteria bacterium]